MTTTTNDPAENLVQRLHAEAGAADDEYLEVIEAAFYPDDPKQEGEQTSSRVFSAIDSADAEDLERLGAIIFGHDDPDVTALREGN